MSGKGDSPRPVNGDRFRQSFDRIFRGNQDRMPVRHISEWKTAPKCRGCGKYAVLPCPSMNNSPVCQNCRLIQ